jgi:hypothetical protein
MSFFKQNKLFFTVIIVCMFLFFGLQLVSCNLSEEIDKKTSLITKENQNSKLLQEDLLNYQGLIEDLRSANADLLLLSELEKEQHRFWENILDENQNIFTSWKKKSPESINADITRLYTQLREICKEKNIYFEEENIQNIVPFGLDNQETETKYGFGLSSYDGFWPSFSNEEARMLGIQSKVVAKMIEYLSESSTPEHAITLIQILRESVGEEDSQHIAGDLLTITNLENKLVRFEEGINSFVFLIKFRCHTSHARSFINQLRPPFLLRDFMVSRSNDGNNFNVSNQTSVSPFDNEQMESEQPLPIVQNVESEFSLLIEYVYEVNRDIETFLIHSMKNENVNKNILGKFLEASGNSKLITKINKKFE